MFLNLYLALDNIQNSWAYNTPIFFSFNIINFLHYNFTFLRWNIALFYIFKYLFNIIVQYKLSYVYWNLSFLHHMEGVAGPDTLYCTVYSIKKPQELTRRDDSCFSLDIVFAPCPWTTGVRFYKLVLEKNNGFKKNTIYMKKNTFFMDAILFLISS